MGVEGVEASLCQAAARLARVTERALDAAGLSLPQYRVLAFLAQGPSAGVALAERLAVSPPSVTALVDGLVQRGLVSRTRDGQDRRRVEHAVTKAGQAALADADEDVGARLDALLEHLPASRRQQAIRGLAALRDALDADRVQRLAGAR